MAQRSSARARRRLARSLRSARTRLGLTQRQAGERLGVSALQVSHWECGRSEPTVSSLIALADAYGLSLDALTGRVPGAAA